MRSRPMTIKFLLVVTAILAVTAMLTGLVISAARGNVLSLPPLIFAAMISPLAIMTLAYWMVRLSRQ